MELDSCKREMCTINQINFNLEKRISDLEEIITLLKNNKVRTSDAKQGEPSMANLSNAPTENRNSTKVTKTTYATKTSSNKQKPEVVEVSSDKNKNNKQEIITTEQVNDGIEKAWNNIHRSDGNVYKQSKRTKLVIGANNNTNNVVIKSVASRGYLHVCRCGPGNTSENLLQFLRMTAPNINFECEVLRQNKITTSFKVVFPIDRRQEVYDPNIWPSGVAVRRFFQSRISNFQRGLAEIAEDPTGTIEIAVR